jgi:polysaccharide transporter, PST family
MSIRRRVLRSGAAVAGSAILARVIQMGGLVILARILFPEDFGAMTLATAYMGAFSLLAGLGLLPFVVVSKEDLGAVLFNAALLSAGSGAALMTIAIALAPAYAAAFDMPQLAPLTRLLSLAILLASLDLLPRAVLMRQSRFDLLAISAVAGPAVMVSISIVLALEGLGVWSLAIGSIAGTIVSGATTFAAAIAVGSPDLRLVPRVNLPLMGRMSKFGCSTMGTSVVQYAYNHGDDLVVGKMIGAPALGLYAQAYALANFPVDAISRVTNSVLLPAYSAVGEDKSRLASAFLTSMSMLALATVPIALGMMVLAHDLIMLAFGERWLAAVPILQVFMLLSLLRPLSGASSPLFLSLGRPHYNLMIALVQAGSMVMLIPLFLRWGAEGVAAAVAGAFAIGFVFNMYLVCRRTGMPIFAIAIVRELWPILFSGIVMALLVAGVREIAPLQAVVGASWQWVLLLAPFGAAVYAGVLTIASPRIVREVLQTARIATALQGSQQ